MDEKKYGNLILQGLGKVAGKLNISLPFASIRHYRRFANQMQ